MPALLLTLLLVGIGWYFLIRPQQQRLRDQRNLVQALKAGDRVITAGGIHGLLTEVTEETVQIEVAPGVVLTLARAAIARLATTEAEPPEHIDAGPDSVPELVGDTTEDIVNDQTDGSIPGGPA